VAATAAVSRARPRPMRASDHARPELPRRQHYRRLGRAATRGAAGLAACLLAVIAADAGRWAIAGVVLLVAVVFARRGSPLGAPRGPQPDRRSGEYTAVLTQDPADAERVVVPLEHAGAASPRTRRLPVAGRTLRLGLLVSVKSVARIEVTREPRQATVATIALRPARTLSPRSCGQPAPRWPVADRGRSQGGSCVRIPEGTPDPRSASSSESSMRLAIFSDVHGQVGRLSACLEAVARTGADEMGRLSDERYVREALRRLPGWLCAHGHTHQAALWIGRSDGTIERQRRPTSQRLGRSMRAVACPGALSGPDPSWLLVDTVRRGLTWHRIDAGGAPPGSVSADRYPSSGAKVHVSVGRQGGADS
jgi:hypothetical protein